VHLRYRPVLEVLAVRAGDAQSARADLIRFVGHVSVLAWGREGEAWESPRLSWEGLTGLRIEGNTLHGLGWDMKTDKDLPFALDLKTGLRIAD
jgi:hypothetical protein